MVVSRYLGTPEDPGSWNRYTYVGGDPINFHDPEGLYGIRPDDSIWSGVLWFSVFGFGGPQVSKPADPTSPRIDTKTNALARGLLKKRLSTFDDSNCDRVFKNAKIDLSRLKSGSGSLNFYNVSNGSPYLDQPLSYIDPRLSKSSPYYRETVGSVAPNRANTFDHIVLLAGDFFGVNLKSLAPATQAAFGADQQNTLLHEAMHALVSDLKNDSDFFNNSTLVDNGLDPSAFFETGGCNTEDITHWLDRDCEKHE